MLSSITGSGRKTIKQSRQATAARQAKFKAKKKASAAEPPKSEAVTKTPVTASKAGKPTLDPRATASFPVSLSPCCAQTPPARTTDDYLREREAQKHNGPDKR